MIVNSDEIRVVCSYKLNNELHRNWEGQLLTTVDFVNEATQINVCMQAWNANNMQ